MTSEPLTPQEEALIREGLAGIPSPDDPEPMSAIEAGRRLWADRCKRILATLDAARLSHDRGADAEWEALALDLRLSRSGTTVEYYLNLHRPLIEAALRSVPAPTLPALDDKAVAKRLAEMGMRMYGGPGGTHKRPPNAADVALMLEALRDAV